MTIYFDELLTKVIVFVQCTWLQVSRIQAMNLEFQGFILNSVWIIRAMLSAKAMMRMP
jgi:hypothetical protein